MQPLDPTNLEILSILQEKARIPNIEVSRLINLAPSAVLERIRKMESQGIIDGYEVRLNPEQFNRALIAFLQVFPGQPADTEAIGEALRDNDAIQEVHFVAGEDCFLVKVRVADMAALNDLIQTTFTRLAGIRMIKTLPVLATHKETARIPIPTLDKTS